MGVFSELKPKNDVRRNPFDLSCFSTYNTKCGLALPLKFWPTLPNSEYELDLKALMRTQPLHTAAFAGFTFNYDVVWTPNNDHYSSFNQFIAQRLNKQHATQPDINQIPNFKLVPFVELLINMGVWDTLASELSTNDFIFYHDNQSYQVTCPRFFMYSEHLPEESMVLSCFRTLDLLEYGNYLGLLKQVVNAVKYYLDNNVTYAVTGQKSWPYLFRFLAWMQGQGATTIADMVGLTFSGNDSTLVGDIGSLVTLGNHNTIMNSVYGYNLDHFLNSADVCVDLWPVMCYNKAWWQFYRNEYYDEKYVHFGIYNSTQLYYKYETDYVYMFNMDDISATISPNPTTLMSADMRLITMFAVKPHQYKKDLFTGNLPSTQYGSVSVASADDVFAKLIGNSVSGGSLPITPTDNRQVYLSKGLTSSNNDAMGTGFNTSYSTVPVKSDKFKFDPAPMINMLELRRADSLQRFRERMLRAGNRTKDIFQAHGWESPMSEKAFEAEFYGSFDGRLNLNVVASTNENPAVDLNLGQLAANGVGAIGGSKIRFKSHDFGTLLIIAYITKDAVYDAYGIHKSHTLLEPWDFPYPELQNVSLAPVAKENLFNSASANSDVLGYLPQNMAYKTANDLVHGEFFTVPFADVSGSQYLSHMKESDMMPMGIFSNMVTPRLDIARPKSLAFYYIQPSCADNIFVQLASPLQDSDQFFGNVHFDLKCVQPLDVIGLPI